jgi:hypothetical protein
MAKKLSAGEKSAHVSGKYLTRNQIIAGLFSIVVIVLSWWLIKSNNNEKKPQLQNINEQKADSGSISNYNAGRDVKIENTTYNNLISKETPQKDNPEQKTSNDIDKKKSNASKYTFNAPVDNRGGAIGDNNTVNNYDVGLEKPRIKFISEKKWKGKELIQDIDYFDKDSLYKTTLYFDYYSPLQKSTIVAFVEKVYGLEYVKIYYPDIVASVIPIQVEGSQVKGMRLVNPMNGKLAIDIYTKESPLSLRKFSFIRVDSIEYSLK